MSGFAHAEQLAFGAKLPLSGFRNFLLLDHSLALGTAIHGTPLVSALRAVLPDSRIIAAASGFALGILRDNPGLEDLVAVPSPFTDLRGSVQALRTRKLFDGAPYAVLQTTGNGRTKVTLAAMLSGGHTRAGFNVHPELSRAPLAFDPARSQISNNLGIISALGHDSALQSALAAHPELAEPQIFPAEQDYSRIRDLLAAQGLTPNRPLAVFVTQTSPTQRKSWRPERFRLCAETLGRDYGAQIVFGGTASESAAIDGLREGLAVPSANLAGKTSLLEMGALFGLADIALTLDTGPMHLGRAMRTPLVIIAPAWSPPIEWLPVGNPRARILKNLDLPSAPDDYVIDEVTGEEALAALHDLLSLYPPGPRSWHERKPC